MFDKGYMPNESIAHFIVDNLPVPRPENKRYIYKITDYNGDPVKDVWYPKEIQPISQN